MTMKKIFYEAPEAELLELRIEENIMSYKTTEPLQEATVDEWEEL